MTPLDLTAAAEDPPPDLAAVPYSEIPFIPRRWIWDGYIPAGSPVIVAAAGETGKGFLLCAIAARVVLGLPMPGEDETLRREPGRVVWITGPGEDDLFEDMAPRLRAAIAHAVAEFGLDPELASETGAIRLVCDLSYWPDGNPVTLPADCPRITSQLQKMNAQEGAPPVAMVVADSISALLSEGYTINSRQGARRVLGMLSRFARQCDVAMPVIHHMTKDRKIAGSPAVMDALRLVLRIDRSKDNPDIRTISRQKSNISDAAPLCYVIRGDGPAVHAEFTDAADLRTERVKTAEARSGPQTASGTCRHPSRLGTAEQCPDCPVARPGGDPRTARALANAAADPGPFRVLRQVRAPGEERGRTAVLGSAYATRGAARAAAVADAGAVLAWRPGDRARMEVAAYRAPDGTTRGYLTCPAPVRNPEQSVSESS